MVISYRTYGLALGLAVVGGVLPVALGSRTGADPAYNGGVRAFGATCFSCHDYNAGPGRVELLGLPPRYRPGALYDLVVRVVDSQQVGAGFEISAENAAGHQGTLLRTDTLRTRFSPGSVDSEYLTHTGDGVEDAIANWVIGGGSYEYHLAWQAPATDVGRITVFAAGNAINDGQAYFGDRYYATDATLGFARAGDVDGDGDADLFDFAALANCVGAVVVTGGDCDYADTTGDSDVALDDLGPWIAARTGPTATLPAGYVLADPVRGGRLYDRWWTVAGAPRPTGNHPLYPVVGVQTGSTTFRCKECHGWDYKGADGGYATGSHFTGIRGVLGSGRSPRELFELLQADPATTPNGHNLDAYGMTDRDLWDVVRMTLESVVDTDDFVAPNGAFIGDEGWGNSLFYGSCAGCHGEDGTGLNFGTDLSPEYVGTVATDIPAEFLHKVRFGHPGSSMPAFDLLRLTVQDAASVGKFCQTLPIE